ncbi:Polyketide cyclase / dehydrase and lipid transport [Spirosomataceae bacterium TFI 002]|nr:Polyketide cyclase / dehydrase and lipid transport [Spirosomataceae bacterium TFI 002]
MKMIIIYIAVALLAFLAYGFYQASKLTSIQIMKEVTINADKQEVFDMVKYLMNFPKWSPFLAQDPSQKYEIKGTDGEVGVQYHWDGNGGKDLGYQEIITIEEGKYIGMSCVIQKPFVAKPTFDYTFSETGSGIKVTQDFQLKSGMVDAFFMWLFGARKAMEATNEQGMQLLKESLEQ